MIEDGEHVVLELKDVSAFPFRKDWDPKAGSAPLKFTIQLQHQMLVTGWKKGYLVALCGMEVYPIEVLRHDRLIESMKIEYEEFWSYVRDNREPPVSEDDSEETYQTIAQVHPPGDFEFTQLDDESSAAADLYKELQQSLKEDQAQSSREP